jgi:hypothetical protein
MSWFSSAFDFVANLDLPIRPSLRSAKLQRRTLRELIFISSHGVRRPLSRLTAFFLQDAMTRQDNGVNY